MSAPAPRWQELTAIFGGRFDPPHLGHVEAVAGLFQMPGVARVIVMPSGNPPHKAAQASDSARLELARAAFLAGPTPGAIEVSDLEVERARGTGQLGYAFDTLQDLRRQHGDRLAFVIGADQLRDLPKWHRFPEILGLCHWIVLERKPNGPAMIQEAISTLTGSGVLRQRPDWSFQGLPCLEVTQAPGKGVLICPTEAREVSSTQIREDFARGIAPESLPLPSQVIEGLKRLNLYGRGN